MTAPAQPAGPRIAVVADDDLFQRQILGDVLRERGFEVVEATDGAEAVAATMLNLDSLGVVLLDLTMPNIDGFAVLNEVRVATRERRVPIVVVTGTGFEKAQQAMELGADQAVMKGATPEEIGALIDLTLEAAAG